MKCHSNYHFSGSITTTLLVVLGLLMGGCSSKEESAPPKPKQAVKTTQATDVLSKTPTAKVEAPSTTVKKEEVTKPAVAKAVPADLESKIVEAKNLFTWYNLHEEYKKAGVTDAKVDEALKTKEKELLTAKPPKSVTKGLELVAFEWKRLSEVKPAEMVKHHLAMLFRVTGKPSLTADQKLGFVWRAVPKPEHVEVLVRNGFKNPYQKDQPPQFIEEWFPIVPAAETWQTGTYVSIETEVEVPRLPYGMEMKFTKNSKAGMYMGPYGTVSLLVVE